MTTLPVAHIDYTKRAKILLKETLENILRLAALCDEVHSAWGYELYEKWVIKELAMSDWYAKNMLRIYRRFIATATPLPPNITLTILTNLAENATPSAAVREILSLLDSGASLTGEASKTIIEQHKNGVRSLAQYIDQHAPEVIKRRVVEQELSVRDAYALVQRLEQTTPEVREVALRHAVSDAGVVNALERIAEKLPDQFADMRQSGFLPAEGGARPIALRDANARDAESAYKQTRTEQILTDWEGTRAARPVDERWAKVLSVEPAPDDFGDDMGVITILVTGSGLRAGKATEGRILRLILQELVASDG